MNVREAYDEWAATYDADRNLTRDLDQSVIRELLANSSFGSLLEIGCGTGKNTVFLARVAKKVRSLDFSEAMIAQAREKVRGDNVSFALADLTRPWPVDDRSVELVVGNLVLEHIRDLSFIFGQAARVLTPGGRFLVCELHPFRQYQGSVARFQRENDVQEIPAHVHHLSDFFTAGRAHGFELRDVREWSHPEDQAKPPRLVSLLFELGKNPA